MNLTVKMSSCKQPGLADAWFQFHACTNRVQPLSKNPIILVILTTPLMFESYSLRHLPLNDIKHSINELIITFNISRVSRPPPAFLDQGTIDEFVNDAWHIGLVWQAFIDCLSLQFQEVSFWNPYVQALVFSQCITGTPLTLSFWKISDRNPFPFLEAVKYLFLFFR